MQISKSAIFYLVLAAVIWGATVPIMKITLIEVPLFSLIVIRMTIASLLILPFVYKRLTIEKEDFKIIFLSAVFGTNLNLAFFFYGLEYSHAINGSVILATTPIVTLIFAHIYLKEKVSSKLIAGVVLSLLGVITIVGIPIFGSDIKSTIGNLSLFASTLAWVAHEIFAKKALKKYEALPVVFYTTSIGASLFFPLMLMELVNQPTWYSNVSTKGWLGLAYGAFFASLIAYTAWQKGLQNTTASTASLVFYLLPITGIIFSIILLAEKFTTLSIIGSILVLLGVILAEYHRKTKPLQKSLHD